MSRYEKNFENHQEYQFGDFLFNSLIIPRHLHYTWPEIEESWTIIFQICNEIKGKHSLNDVVLESTRSYIFYLFPQVNYTHKELWNLSIIFD